MVCDNSWLADVDLGMVKTCLKVRKVRICDRRCSGTGIEDGLFWGSKTATITIPAPAITTGSQARLFRLLRFLKGLCCWLIEPPVRLPMDMVMEPRVPRILLRAQQGLPFR